MCKLLISLSELESFVEHLQIGAQEVAQFFEEAARSDGEDEMPEEANDAQRRQQMNSGE